jgi:hypothetical protein
MSTYESDAATYDPGIDLAQFDDDYAEAPIEERDFEPLPDGRYQVVVEKVELTRAQSSGNPMLKWTLRVLGPQHKGRLLWRNSVMASRENLKWLKSDLHTCGLDLAKLSDLPTSLDRLLDVHLEVVKRTRNEAENIFFNRRIVTEDTGQGYDAAAQDALNPF